MSKPEKTNRSRNTNHGDALRGGSKTRGTGKRGRKRRKQDRRVERQDKVNARERREELDKRALMMPSIRDWAIKLCGRSTVGLIIPRHVKDLFREQGRVSTYCVAGLVLNSLHGIDSVEVEEFQPWEKMSSEQLKRLKKRQWKPHKPKNLLDIIANEL